MAYTTVRDFTDDVNELTYGCNGPYVLTIRDLLSKSGIDIYNKYSYDDIYEYDAGMEQAVMDFQKAQGLTQTGIVNDETLNALINVSNNMADIIYSEGIEDTTVDTTANANPHFDSFFSKDNLKDARRNQQDIKIVLGNSTITKTIHNVYIRSVSTEFDTSGNPISEIYEFIAQDLTESDEYKDGSKYE
jgi:peptidoglycan hydrolase-like protein with peptidoglycan-binding domain